MEKSKTKISGDLLVADYQAAFISAATTQVAKSEAERSESELLSQLSYWSRGGYLSPGNIEAVQQEDVSRASLDAHVKKVQAQQLDTMNASQLAFLSEENKSLYTGKKVRVEAIPTSESPFDAVWFSPQTGFRSNTVKKPLVSGTIQEVLLDRNILVLKPRLLPRLINKEFAAYFVYVVDPLTAEPMVKITLL